MCSRSSRIHFLVSLVAFSLFIWAAPHLAAQKTTTSELADYEVLKHLAQQKYRTGAYEDAEKVLAQMRQMRPEKPDVIALDHSLANLYLMMLKPELAEKYYELAKQAGGNVSPSTFKRLRDMRSALSLEKQGKVQDALEYMQQCCIAQDESTGWKRVVIPRILIKMGQLNLRSGLREEAIKNFQEFIQIAPYSPDAKNVLTLLAGAKGR